MLSLKVKIKKLKKMLDKQKKGYYMENYGAGDVVA